MLKLKHFVGKNIFDCIIAAILYVDENILAFRGSFETLHTARDCNFLGNLSCFVQIHIL